MPDIFDQAQERDQQQLDEAMRVQAARAAAMPRLEYIGICHNPKCGDEISIDKLFCNSTCAAEHARFTRKI